MYNGYRLKINGYIIENKNIARGSYSIIRKRRVIASYYDAAGYKHEELSRRETHDITFTIREMSDAEYNSVIRPALEKTDWTEVEYWDDIKQEYGIGYFKIKEYTLSHENALKNEIRYKSTQITLEEY